MRGGAPALEALRGASRIRVVSVHQRAANLLLDEELLVGLLPMHAPLHPWATHWRGVVELSSPAEVSDGDLVVGPKRVNLAQVEVIDLRLHEHGATGVATELERTIELDGGWADACVASAIDLFLASRDPRTLVGIIGVGEGLTPSGDDLMVGILGALDLCEERSSRAVLEELLPPLLRANTTALASQLVAAALDGHYAEPLLALLTAIARGDLLREHADAVARIGHRSGMDLLRGVAVGLRYCRLSSAL